MQRELLANQIEKPHEIIHLGPLALRFLVTADDSGGSVAVMELTVPAGRRLEAPAHSHAHFEETVYGLEGAITWTVDGRRIDVADGDALCIPRGAVHRFDNNGGRDAKALCVLTPAAIGPAFFRECADVIDAAAGGPPDVARLVAIMQVNGLKPAAQS
jgi:quercetin dioxygenase-like cupin family protein